MAKTTKTPENSAVISDDELELTPGERIEIDEEAAILSEFDEADDNTKWSVSICKVRDGGGGEDFILKVSPAEFPILERLRDEFGSGTYAIRVYKNGRIHKYFKKGILALKKPEPPQATPSQQTDGLQAIAQQMQRQADMIERLVTERRQPIAQAVNPFEMMTTLLGAIGQIRGLFAPAGNAGVEQIELFMKGVEAAKELGGGSGESSITDIFRDLLKSPLVEKMLESAVPVQQPQQVPQFQQRQPGIGEAPQPLQPTSQPAPQSDNQQTIGSTQTTEQHDTNSNQVIMAMLQHNMRYLCTKAANNADVDLYADWVIDNVPREILMQLASDPNALQTIATHVPEVQTYAVWFARLFASIQQALTEEPDGAQDTDDVQPSTPTGSNGAS